jgi:hypothetical protein
MRKASQCDRILAYIKENGSITPLEAIREFGCMRLASRMTDLKRRGYDVKSIMETSTNKNGETVRFARYTICE